MMSNKQDQLRAGIREAVVASVSGMLSSATAGTVHHVHRKSPSKKLNTQLNNEAGLVFADPHNIAVVRTWATRVLSRAIPLAMKITDAQCQVIGDYAAQISAIIDATDGSRADLLSQVGGYVIHDNKLKLDAVSRTLRMRTQKQKLSVPVPSHIGNGAPGARTQSDDPDYDNKKLQRISLNGNTRQRF